MQIKATMRYRYTPIRNAKIKKMFTTPNADKDAEKLDHSDIARGIRINWYSHSRKQFTVSFKTISAFILGPTIALLGIYPG